MSSRVAALNWTRLARFIAKEDGKVHYGQPTQDNVDIGLALHRGEEVKAYEITPDPFTGQVNKSKVLHIDQLLSPVSRQTAPGAIRCIGINFKGHVEEAKMKMPEVPVMFMKGANALAGPGKLLIPKFAKEGEAEQLDFESELAVVLSKDTKDVSEKDALSHVLGFTSSNDVSARHHQLNQTQWCFGKGLDNTCPIGPVLVRPSEFDPFNVNFRGTLNGKVMQESNTNDHIFNVSKLISYLSSGTTLPAGSVILLGTPSGIGWFRSPRELMKEGDTFIVTHDGPIGSLVNTIEYET
ncbi:hypothetical protein CBS101457_002943 [Exobasidium rhododendri]|nr:hypothetical protein CBS101457_002943 [Exobasidium rhododendri]